MASLIDIPHFEDARGVLGVIDRLLPFEIRRIYFIDRARGVRGGHRHKRTRQAALCLRGSCEFHCYDGVERSVFRLTSSRQALLLETPDWHIMKNFSEDALLLILASEHYDRDDYIDEEYP